MRYAGVLFAGLQLVAAAPQMSGMGGMSGSSSPSSSEDIPPNGGRTMTIPPGTKFEPSLNMTSVTPGGKVYRVRYGPYHLGAMTMAENVPDINIPKPCPGECFVVAMQADLQDASGKSVNIDTGAWLHHMVMALGGEKQDTVCPILPSRIFASGNERTAVRMNNKLNYGIQMKPTDRLSLLYDLINNSKSPVDYYIVMTYETTTDSSYKPVTMAWIDVTGNCGTSYVAPREGKFVLSNAPSWRSNVAGHLLSATGHVHDGGINVTLSLDGKVVCSSPQIYGTAPQYIEAETGMNPGLAHISETGSCMDFGTISVGQVLTIDAMYDTSQHPLNKMADGSTQEIMGISQVYIGA